MPADDKDLLPQPPPPRPARRDAAIEAALHRFDGEPAAPEPRASRANSWTRHPQLGLALAASLVVVIGFPAAFIVLRDQASSPAGVSAPPSPSLSHRAVPPGMEVDYEAANAAVREAPTEPKPIDQLAKVQSVAPAVQADEKQAASAADNVANDLPAAPPPPPPPPPPPSAPPPALAQKSAKEAVANELVVTGSRVRQPNSTTGSDLANREQRATDARAEMGESEEPYRSVGDRAYAAFVTRLQAAVRANDRNGVIALIEFPLRVNSRGRSRFYRDARSVRTNYDRIFTPKVTQAILSQRPDSVVGNQSGWMIGQVGEVWFDQKCPNPACSPSGPIRIKAINN